MAIATFNGKVVLSSNSNPLVRVKVEIWHAALGNIGSAVTDIEGLFSVTTTSAVSPGQSVTYKLFRNGTLLLEIEQTYESEALVTLSVSDTDLDAHVDDNIPEEEFPNYILVRGILKDTKGSVIDGAKIQIYENGFRTKTLLASTSTDSNGQYKCRISTKKIGHSKAFDNARSNRSLRVEARTESNELIAGSDSLSNWDDILDVNLNAIDNGLELGDLVLTEFEQMVSQIDTITEGAAIADVSENGTDGVNEIAFIANALGRHEREVANLVKAHQFAGQLSANNPELMFALTRNTAADENPVLKLSAQEIRDAIADAKSNGTISNVASGDIDNFVNAARTHQVSETRNLSVNNETFRLENVLLPIFDNDSSALNNFLGSYNDADRVTSEEFWGAYEGHVGAPEAKKVKMGMQLSAITGFQPEVIASLLHDATHDYNGIQEFATWSEGDWKDRIDAVSSTAGRTTVPGIIKNATENDTQAKGEYAKTLKTTFQDVFPLTYVKAQFDGSDGSALIEDDEHRTAAKTFIENNPEVDLRLIKVYDINSHDYDMTGVDDENALKESLLPFQRLLRIVGGKPEAVTAMKIDGIDSAEALLDLPVEDFVSNYSELLGGADQAAQAYATAQMINTAASAAVVALNSAGSQSTSNIQSFPSYSQNMVAAAADDPNLRVLFGNLDYCSCQECLSVYSPAAYLTDMLNFLRQRCPAGYNELIRRRGDLINIDLTCKNTNTPVPYIDLVNELFENYILDRIKTNYSPVVVPPKSYQTNGTAAELAAHPEHVEKKSNVYVDNNDYPKVYDDVLSLVAYPYSVPFSLALEESRVYFEHMGISRYDLMKLYRTSNVSATTPPTNQVTDFAIYAEALGVSYQSARIISDITLGGLWFYYGIAGMNVTTTTGVQDPAGGSTLLAGQWDNLLINRIDVLCQQVRITYKELLQLLNTDILNLPNSSGIRGITIDVNSVSAAPDTCNLAELKLVFSGSANSADFLGKLFRFIRLIRAEKLSISEWDILLRSLNITDLNNTNNVSGSDFQRLGRALALAERLNISPIRLATWWNNVDTNQYTNFNSDLLTKFPSVYDTIFRNRSVINPPLADFHDLGGIAPGFLPSSSDLPSSYSGFTAAIAACCGIKEEEVLLLLDYMQLTPAVAVNISSLSKVYALSRIANNLGLTIREMIRVMKISSTQVPFYLYASSVGVTPSTGDIIAMLDLLDEILTKVDGIKRSEFSLDELSYLILDVDPTDGAIAPNNKNIQSFYEELRKELKTYPAYVKPSTPPAPHSDELAFFQKLSNVVYQRFTKEFNVSTEILAVVFPGLVLPSGDIDGLIYDLLNNAFVQSSIDLIPSATIPVSSLAVSELYDRYVYLRKVFSLVQRWHLNAAEFSYLYDPANSAVIGFSFQNLPANATPLPATVASLFAGMMRTERWVEVKEVLRLTDDSLVDLLVALDAGNKPGFISIVEANTDWGSMLVDLIGVGGTTGATGLLNTSFTAGDFTPSNDRAALTILKIKTIIGWSRSTGLNPTAVRTALLAYPNFLLKDAHNVLLAAKSKHTEEDWLKIAKPLRDVLRNKQRKALVDYIITISEPSVGKKWA